MYLGITEYDIYIHKTIYALTFKGPLPSPFPPLIPVTEINWYFSQTHTSVLSRKIVS